MNKELKSKVDLMVENFHEYKKGFAWETGLIKHFAAMTSAAKDTTPNIEKIKEIKAYIKEETSWTSNFRGVNIFMLSNLLSFEEDYRNLFKDMLFIYEKMRTAGFRNSVYLPLAAYTAAKESDREDWDYIINRMGAFYNFMKKNHYWLTSQDDYVYAAVLATTDLNVEETSVKIENCYITLNNNGFAKGNYLQTLSHVLAMNDESVEVKCSKAKSIYNKLIQQKCRLHYHGLATLGLVTLVAADEDKIVDEIKEVYDYLYEKDGYGLWGISKDMRTMLSAALVSDFYVSEFKKGLLQITLGSSINSIVIAQQQASIAAACAASAAAASSAS